jgi:hypothetical protein
MILSWSIPLTQNALSGSFVKFSDQVIALLNELKIPYRWLDHPAVFTVAESMAIQSHGPVNFCC